MGCKCQSLFGPHCRVLSSTPTMENPEAEIEDVILTITTALNPEIQNAAIYK